LNNPVAGTRKCLARGVVARLPLHWSADPGPSSAAFRSSSSRCFARGRCCASFASNSSSLDARSQPALDARASGNAFVQYNSTTDRLDFNVRLRYAFAEGTDLWLVYNEGLDTDPLRDAISVRSPASLARAVLLEYTHTFGF
jgi:hypothetical protein